MLYRLAVLCLLGVGFGLLGIGRAQAGAEKKAEIETDLAVVTARTSAARARPGEPLRLSAHLVNQSKTRAHKVIRAGSGCSMGIVEPYITYSARYTPHDGAARDIEPKPFRGMCGMGDYRWHRLVTTLRPGKSIDIGQRISVPNASLDMKAPGRYAVQVHYAFRGKGTMQKLPQADPVGDLGPLKGHPKFEIVSKPLVFDVVRPIEIFVEPTGVLKAGAPQALSRLVRVRFENWQAGSSVTLDNTRLKIFLELKPAPKGPRIKRETMAKPAMVVTKTLAPEAGLELIGPSGGWFDQTWTTEGKGGVTLRVIVAGYAPGAPRVASHWVTIPGA